VSISAPATYERQSVSVKYLDIVLVLLAGIPVVALGAPELGYAVGAGAWTLQRLLAVAIEQRIETLADQRRRLGISLASSMGRVWLMAAAIMIVGVTATRADGLTAALVIFAAFSFTFARTAFAHVTRTRSNEPGASPR
jgi:hypothetical protein